MLLLLTSVTQRPQSHLPHSSRVRQRSSVTSQTATSELVTSIGPSSRLSVVTLPRKVGADPRKNVRCIIRMLESIEKARKIISSTSDSNINIDYLLEEEDLNFNLKREEFEKMVEPLTSRFTELLLATIAESGKFQI